MSHHSSSTCIPHLRLQLDTLFPSCLLDSDYTEGVIYPLRAPSDHFDPAGEFYAIRSSPDACSYPHFPSASLLGSLVVSFQSLLAQLPHNETQGSRDIVSHPPLLTYRGHADVNSWHETQAVYSCDFQPLPIGQLKRLLSEDDDKEKDKSAGPLIAGGRQYRLATAGGDSKVRVSCTPSTKGRAES